MQDEIGGRIVCNSLAQWQAEEEESDHAGKVISQYNKPGKKARVIHTFMFRGGMFHRVVVIFLLSITEV